MKLHARVELSTVEGKPVAPLARCVEIGLGGARISATESLVPGTRVLLAVRLPGRLPFVGEGRVVWSRETIRPALLGSPKGKDDDAEFGIAFEGASPEALLPIARLCAARDREVRRAHRIRRLHGLPIHA